MPFIKVKCQDCEKDYNAFIFPPSESGKKLGLGLKDYKCPHCRSTNKAIYKGEVSKLDKITEGFTSMKDAVQTKIFPVSKSSDEKQNGISK